MLVSLQTASCALTCVFACYLLTGCAVGRTDPFFQGFEHPPTIARPFVRWWWPDNAINEDEIVREIGVLKSAGIGGFEINPIGKWPYAKSEDDEVLTWLSPQWCNMVQLAAATAKKNGMEADLIVGTGWPFGGDFLEPDEQHQRIVLFKKKVSGPSKFEMSVREIIASAGTKLKTPRTGLHHPRECSQTELMFIQMVPDNLEDYAMYPDLKNCIDANDLLIINVPKGNHTLYAGVRRVGYDSVVFPAPGVSGPILDHYNKETVEKYLNRMSDALFSSYKEIGKIPLRAMFCDSIELARANWTKDFSQEFMTRRGYAIEPYLLFVLDEERFQLEISRRVRYDFYKTLVELFQENFIETFHKWCHESGFQSRFQAYGTPWLMGMLDGYLIPDIPEGETWIYWLDMLQNRLAKGHMLDQISFGIYNKYASSAAHVTGKPLVGCEAMTNTMGVFKTTLEDIKQAGDIGFATGVNHNILHGFNYSPPEAEFPGWVIFGTYFSEHNPWWPYLRYWADYNARISWVLQQAKAKMDIAIYGPTDDVWSKQGLAIDSFIYTPWYLHLLWEALHQNGYNADYMSDKVIQNAIVKNGKICIGAQCYNLLMVTDVETVEPATAKIFKKLAAAGAKLLFVGKKPHRSPGFQNSAHHDQMVQDCMRDVFNRTKTITFAPSPEEGKLLEWVQTTLPATGVEPAVKLSTPNSRLFQVHYTFENRNIFLFVNSDRTQPKTFHAVFSTGGKTPWRWDAQTGKRSIFPFTHHKNELDIHLRPLESLLLVFEPDLDGEPEKSPSINRQQYIDIQGPWEVEFRPVQGTPFSRTAPTLQNFVEEDELNSFAGQIIYQTEFRVADEMSSALLSLGNVEGVSEIFLNDRKLGVRYWGDHNYVMNQKLKPGRYKLKIKISTVLFNYCRTLADNKTARFWTQGPHRGGKPLPFGLLGPIRLYACD